jgi:hypothetical protein
LLFLAMDDTDNRPIATGIKTFYGRELFRDRETEEPFSEKTITVPFGDGFVVIPSVDESGMQLSQDFLENFVREAGAVDPVTGADLPVFESISDADEYARNRSKAIAFDLRQRQRPQAPLFAGRLRFQGGAGTNVNPYSSVQQEQRVQRSGVGGDISGILNLPGGVSIQGDANLVYEKQKIRRSPEFIEYARSFGVDLPENVERGTRGIVVPRANVTARAPVLGGIGSLEFYKRPTPQSPAQDRYITNEPGRSAFLRKDYPGPFGVRAGLRVPIPVQGGILRALGLNK